jgi:polygalacturonase
MFNVYDVMTASFSSFSYSFPFMRLSIVLLIFSISSVAASAREYNIIDYGAVSDTTVLSTIAIQRAIDQCAEAGGGRVVVPAGKYKMGTIVLRSHIDLHLETGATLYGSTSLTDYKAMRTDYLSLRTWNETVQLVYADRVQDVSISGRGTIDGRGAAFEKLSWNDEGITRPHLLRFIQSNDISVTDVTLRNSGCWMQHFLACDRVQIRGIKVFNRNNYNNDALDLDGCHDVVVSDMIVDSDDDGITLKSTSPRLCENITIQNCIVSSHCNAIKLGTETNGGFRNISIANCIIKPSEDQNTQFFGDPSKRGTSAISLEITDGGTMENVHVSGLVVEGTESPIFIRLGNRARGYAQNVPVSNVGSIRGIHLQNITVNGAGPTGCSITGLPGHPVSDIWLSDITIRQRGGCQKTDIPVDEKEKDYPEATMWGILPAKGFFIRHAHHITLHNIEVTTDEPDERPMYVRVDVE